MANEQIVAYIRANSALYTEDALRDQLLAAGHAPADIEAAFQVAKQVPTEGTWGATFHTGDFWGRYLGLLAAGVLVGWVGVASGSLLVLLVLAILAFGAWSNRFSQPTRRAAGCALLTLVGVPILVIGGIWAYCLIAQPRIVAELVWWV